MTAQGTLVEMHVEGQRRWPSIKLSIGDLRCHCERLCEYPEHWTKARDCAADVYLCCACGLGDPEAISLLQLQSEKLLRVAIARVHRGPDFVEDTLQEFWKKLLVGPDAKIRDYCGRGPLQAWLRLCVTRLAIDRQRSANAVAQRQTDLGDCLADQVFGPESSLTRARFYSPFRDALRAAVTQVTHKERHLLRMHVLERCSIDQISRAYNVHRATVARWLDGTREHILQSVRAQLELAGSHLTDDEFRSVARVLEGDLALDPSLFRSTTHLESTLPTH